MTDSLFPEPDAVSEPLASVADPVSAEPDAPEVSPDVTTEVSPAEATEDIAAEHLAVAEVPATNECRDPHHDQRRDEYWFAT